MALGATAVAARAAGNPGINNTAWLFFILAAAFVFFVTVRGDLPKWLGLFGLGGSPAQSKTSATTPTQPSPGFLGGAVPDVLAGQPANLPPLPAIPGGGSYGSPGGGA